MDRLKLLWEMSVVKRLEVGEKRKSVYDGNSNLIDFIKSDLVFGKNTLFTWKIRGVLIWFMEGPRYMWTCRLRNKES